MRIQTILALVLIIIILSFDGLIIITASASARSRSQIGLFVKVTLTLREDGSSIYLIEGGTPNGLLNDLLPCEAGKHAPLANAKVEESAKRDANGMCIHSTSIEFSNLAALAAFIEKGGGYLQEQGDKIALGMGLRQDKPTPFVRAFLQYIIRMPVIEQYNPQNGIASSYVTGNQVVWQFNSEAELRDIEVRGSLCSCLQENRNATNASKRHTIYFGGAGMNGAYIPNQIEAFKKRCFSNTEAATRTAGTSTDVVHSFLKYRDRVKDESWSLSKSGLETDVGQRDKLNLIGYSYGSLVAAQTALFYADRGIVTENVVLIGSPISNGLLNELKTNPNIRNVSVIDLTENGDAIHAGMSQVELTLAGPSLGMDFSGSSKNGKGHFYYALEGEEGDRRRQELAERIKKIFGECR